ncbi:MAG TPA: hypothetical protein VFW09_10955 [Solirubrobacteraceae bacterium]|nr:hypothetical protein [Solirubrobacteraceae bacterium]
MFARAACAVLALLATAAVASAAPLHWSSTPALDSTIGQSLVQVRCPSATECTTLDANGRTIALQPSTGKAGAPVQVAQGQPATGVSCPAATQCTLVTPAGRAYTYDPQHPRQSEPQTLAPPSAPNADEAMVRSVACPSMSVCVAADTDGNAIRFAPGSSAPAVATSLGSGQWSAIACPSTTQCTTAGQNEEATFNPASPAGATRIKLEPTTEHIIDLSCPTATQCTALDAGGGEVTFNPQTPPMSQPDRLLVANNTVRAITCVSAAQCTTVAQNGREATFDPAAATPTITGARIDRPEIGGGPGQTEGLQSVSCTSTSSCVAVDAVGRAIRFAPSSPGSPRTTRIDGGTPLYGVSCPSTRQCSAMGPYAEITFDPRDKKRTTKHGTVVTDRFFQASGIDCASATRCLAIVTGHQATFAPRRFRGPKLRQLAAFGDAAIVGLQCPSASECVATDTDGYGITYDPRRQRFIRRRIGVERGEALTGAACSARTQCTAIDNDGQALTFQPLTGKRIAHAKIDASVGLDAPSGDSDNELDAVSCPGRKLCVAVDTRGAAVAFDPRSGRSVKPTMIDPNHGLSSVSCPTVHRCVAVDDAGRVLAGGARPSAWKATPLKGAAALNAVDCPSSKECVAVDATGNAFVGRG